MFRTSLHYVVFLLGLVAVCWIGAGYVSTNPVGFAVALLIAVCYLAGGLELYRYRQATASLTAASASAGSATSGLAAWLGQLHPSLRNAVRLRVEGERVALPGPVLTPYLVGLLVVLGMLGTLLGMMATLRGTGLALESATDLQAIRGSLGAPVEGLAVAFGTSIAGVATSAMLGLLSALCRRERLEAVQRLDVEIATTLHTHSQSWQRNEAFRLLQQQAELMPVLVDRLQAMSTAIEQQSSASGERLLANQQRFHAKADEEYARLTAAIEQSLKDSVAESARAVGAALQPVMDTTLAGIARANTTMHETVTEAVQRQLTGLTEGFDASRAATAASWQAALDSQQQTNTALTNDLRAALDGFAAQHDQRALGLLDAVSAKLVSNADSWQAAQSAQQQTHVALAEDLRSTLASFAQTHDARATGLIDSVGSRMEATTAQIAEAWQQALARQDAAATALSERHQHALDAAAATLQAQAVSLGEAMQHSHAQLQDALEARDQQRLSVWTDAFTAMSARLGERWEQTGAGVASRQQEICDTLARTASEITQQAQAHASETISEISRLVQAASEAPKAAADVVAELRSKLSDSLVRDTATLEERSRLLATVETLLDAVNHAANEQRVAVDALVSTSAELLDRVGTRFTDHIQAETGKLGSVAAQVTGSAVEVASLADALGSAVHAFGTASDGLNERLAQIAASLDGSLARSDEQLAYYVAQAREVIDLSVLSQKQIIDELQQLAGRRSSKAGAASA
ncbi:DUF802 domain-containing protein [Stenotrophomonas sp.]|uniref:DUF802 domain-containing protein n=1 Tax=Stenotrophomonas sp. TaxID=69392 RepID=UPI0025D25C9A|nr:DUF802 domain-containing protein [Stenotrophomonas sp.]MBW8374392.1 DUF802 domain-containing protein [Stenotrophomonas sp.]